MPILELLRSGPGTGKTSTCIDLFRKEILKSKGGLESRSFFVLPNREHAERIQNLILKKDVPGVFNAHILTIKDLASFLLGPAAARHPDDGLRLAVLAEILGDPSREWKYFEAVKGFFGFRHLLADAIKELSSGLVSLEALERRAQPLLKDAVFRDKFRDFSVVYKEYLARLEELGLNEAGADIVKLGTEARAELPAMDLVIFDGFYHFTEAQKRLIECVSRHSQRTIVTLTLPDDSAQRPLLFHYPEDTRRFLLGAGFKEIRGGVRPNRRCDEPALLHLLDQVFCVEPKTSNDAAAPVLVMEAPSMRAEAEMIAREARRLYREKKYHYSDMCVILRTVSGYESVLEQVFADFGVPIVVHERKKLIENGFTMTLWRFLNLLREDWKREDVFFVLRSSFLASHSDADAVRSLENCAFARDLRASRAGWQEAAKDPSLPDAAKSLISKLMEWEDSVRAAGSPEKAARFLKKWTRLFSGSSEGGLNGLAFQAIERLLEGVGPAAEGASWNAAGFAERLQEALETALFSVKPPTKNRVQVYDVVMALPKEYKAVFLAGLTQDAFPKDARQDALFGDEERRAMNAGGIVLEERESRESGERYFFYMACARARERLYFSYPLFNSDGRPVLASFFVEEARKCFADGLPVRRKAADEWVPEPSEWESAWDVVRFAAHAGRSAALPAAVAQVLDADASWKQAAAASHRGERARLADPKALALFAGEKGPFSATKLELYATCPFKYFSDRILKLDDAGGGLEFRIMGSILHKSLELFYNKMPAQDRRDPATWKSTQNLKEKLLAEFEAAWAAETRLSHEPLYRRRLFKEEMQRMLCRFIDREAATIGKRKLIPMRFEHEFDDLRIFADHGEIRIRGAIDRIDVEEGSKKALIVDYKRSEKDLSKKIEKELEYQLPIYILVARELLGLDVQGAELQPLRRGRAEGIYRETARELLHLGRKRARSEEDWESFLEESRSRIRNLVERLRQGNISADPKTCDNCDYNPVCRFEKKELPFIEYEKRKREEKS